MTQQRLMILCLTALLGIVGYLLERHLALIDARLDRLTGYVLTHRIENGDLKDER